MTQEQAKAEKTRQKQLTETKIADSYYAILGLHPSASVLDIRRNYRELSKRYHPDTTELPSAIATLKFQKLNEAYATLSNPERRSLYDLKIGYSRINVIQSPANFPANHPQTASKWSNSAYLDPCDRPLSAGEIFALLMMGLALIGCLILVIIVSWLRGDTSLNLAQFIPYVLINF